ncbi:hypothetical protein AB0I72_19515 [Nocardiopsis sp. NPDC049922]|uniref:hypothetical protein n=1 Tax=Nocardiopsis sp. NPDC049922 TaxID=3155157 RepID=UPI0033FA439F
MTRISIRDVSETTLADLEDLAAETERSAAQHRAEAADHTRSADQSIEAAATCDRRAHELRTIIATARGEELPEVDTTRLRSLAARAVAHLTERYPDLPQPEEWQVSVNGVRGRFWDDDGMACLREWAKVLSVPCEAGVRVPGRVHYQITAMVHGVRVRLVTDGPTDTDEQPAASEPTADTEAA